MKNSFITVFSVVLAVALLGGAFQVRADDMTPQQLVDAFISLGIITPDQTAAAEAAVASYNANPTQALALAEASSTTGTTDITAADNTASVIEAITPTDTTATADASDATTTDVGN